MSSAVAAHSVKTGGEVDRLPVLNPLYRSLAPVSSNSWSHKDAMPRHTSPHGRIGLVEIFHSLLIVCLLTNCAGSDQVTTHELKLPTYRRRYKKKFGCGFCVKKPRTVTPCDVYSSRGDYPSLALIAHSYSGEPHGGTQIVLLTILAAIQSFQVGR